MEYKLAENICAYKQTINIPIEVATVVVVVLALLVGQKSITPVATVIVLIVIRTYSAENCTQPES